MSTVAEVRLWGRTIGAVALADDSGAAAFEYAPAFVQSGIEVAPLAPAFDLTYSFQPTGRWTSVHQMTLNGKRDGFTLDDFRACARSASMKRGRAEAIIEEVRDLVSRLPDYADEAGVSPHWRDKITAALRLEPFA